MSEYVIIEDGKTVEHCCGPLQEGRDCREVPDGFPFESRADIRHYDRDWKLRPLADRIAEGLVTVSEAEMVEGETVRAKTALERIRDGIDPAPDGMKVSQDGLDLVAMSIAEQIAEGKMSKATGDTIMALEARAKRGSLLAESDWTHLLDCPLPTEDQKKWTDYRKALRDITEQPGFPKDIEWPVRPDGVQ